MKGPNVTTDSGAPGSTSTSLLERLKTRDPAAWHRLAKVYGPLVYAWCRRRGLQDTDAADVVQEVFQAVALNVVHFRHEEERGSFRGWLWTITRNKLHDYDRRRRSQPQATGGSDAQERLLQVPFEDVEEPSDAAEGGGLVHRALTLIRGEFENRTWQAFWRVMVEGHAPADVAADLGMSTNAVYVAKSKVLRRLRDELGEPSAEA